MKRVFAITAALMLTLLTGAQSLQEIIQKNYEATNQAAFEKAQTIVISARAYQGGMEIPMVISMKNPDMVRINMTVQGMEIVQAFDGTKGYMINPMMGSSDPIEMTAADASNMKNQVGFISQLKEYEKNNKIELAGEETINGKPAWKLKAILPTGDVSMIYIDKASSLQVKAGVTVSQMGTEMNVETFLSDYTSFDGLMIPKTTTSYANGMEMMVLMVEKVELNKPLDNSMFKLK
jgi:outer membrane lipoprotein-sorting protein